MGKGVPGRRNSQCKGPSWEERVLVLGGAPRSFQQLVGEGVREKRGVGLLWMSVTCFTR